MFWNLHIFVTFAGFAPWENVRTKVTLRVFAIWNMRRHYLWKILSLQAFIFGLFIYSCLFFWSSLLNLPFWNNACTDRRLSKRTNMRQKDNLCIWRRHEHQQDQIKKKMSSFKKNPLQFFVNGSVLHNCSENLKYNYIRRLFT